MIKLEITKSADWETLLTELHAMLKHLEANVVVKARAGVADDIAKAVGRYDGFNDAILFLKGLGGK